MKPVTSGCFEQQKPGESAKPQYLQSESAFSAYDLADDPCNLKNKPKSSTLPTGNLDLEEELFMHSRLIYAEVGTGRGCGTFVTTLLPIKIEPSREKSS